jgi:uncharacterized protein YqgQ
LSEQIKLDRETMLINVTSILHKHILAAENYLTSPTIGARIWGENN